MRKRTELIRTFVAHDERGSSHTIHVYTEFMETRTFDAATTELEGMNELRTASGQPVNRIAKGEYEIVDSGMALKSSAPDAF